MEGGRLIGAREFAPSRTASARHAEGDLPSPPTPHVSGAYLFGGQLRQDRVPF